MLLFIACFNEGSDATATAQSVYSVCVMLLSRAVDALAAVDSASNAAATAYAESATLRAIQYTEHALCTV